MAGGAVPAHPGALKQPVCNDGTHQTVTAISNHSSMLLPIGLAGVGSSRLAARKWLWVQMSASCLVDLSMLHVGESWTEAESAELRDQIVSYVFSRGASSYLH